MSTPPNFDPRPVTLHGKHARLEPLTLEHAEDLFAAGNDPEIWRYMPYPAFRSPADARRWIEDTLALAATGSIVPFAIILQSSGRATGSTRYMDIQRANRSLEIGFTWLAPQVQRTPLNTECKYLLLKHAFEQLGAVRVQLKTDGRNEKSQRAIERVGAMREGTLRKHMILPDGFIRDTVYYSIIDSEWPAVKERLEKKMSAPRQIESRAAN